MCVKGASGDVYLKKISNISCLFLEKTLFFERKSTSHRRVIRFRETVIKGENRVGHLPLTYPVRLGELKKIKNRKESKIFLSKE